MASARDVPGDFDPEGSTSSGEDLDITPQGPDLTPQRSPHAVGEITIEVPAASELDPRPARTTQRRRQSEADIPLEVSDDDEDSSDDEEYARVLAAAAALGKDGALEADEADDSLDEGSGVPGEEEFDIVEEVDEEDTRVNAQLAALAERRNYDEWKGFTVRERIFAIVEPSLSVEVEVPPRFLKVVLVYACVYWVATVLHLILFSFQAFPNDFNQNAVRWVFFATCIFFALDLLVRLTCCCRVARIPMILLDIATLVAALSAALDIFPTGAEEVLQYIVPFRSLRLFLVTSLFLHTDTFRDINLAFVTIANSVKSLLIFVVLLVVGLFVFSTGVYLLERGRFDAATGAWFRRCRDFGGCYEERSPFQSIPDAMWLVISAMSTVGLGDVTPASTGGRVVTGIAMIAGVFGIAFPTMVLVGNLALVRRNYFREEETELRLREDAELALLEAQRSDYTKTTGAFMLSGVSVVSPSAANDFGTLPPLQNGDATIDYLPPQGSLDAESGGLGLGIESPPGFEIKQRAYFAFMGDPTREVRVTRNPTVYHYQPIFQVLCDEDGLPLLSCLHQVSDFTYHVQLTLIVDDRKAQEAAAAAVKGGDKFGAPIFCRAMPVFGLEVALATHIPNTKLLRRSDIGEVLDQAVPLTLALVHDSQTQFPIAERFEQLRRELVNAQLFIRASAQAPSCGMWAERVFITAAMLADTPFYSDLKAIAVHVSPDLIQPDDAPGRKPKNTLDNRRDYAFATRYQLEALLRPLLAKWVSDTEVIHNTTDALRQLVDLISLHCRQARLQDLPPAVHRAVYGIRALSPSERLFEVDVDHFRTADWPIGSIVLIRAEEGKLLNLRSTIGSGKGCGQPELDLANFVQPFDSMISMETTILRKEAVDELKKAHEEQVRLMAEVAQRAEESRMSKTLRGAKEKEFDGVALAVETDAEEMVGMPSYDDDDEDFGSDLEGQELTAEEQQIVQQRLLFGSLR